MSGYRQAIANVHLSTGASVRILRELHEMSQHDLAAATRIPRSTISSIENNHILPGAERAKVLARVLRCHVSMLVYPDCDAEHRPDDELTVVAPSHRHPIPCDESKTGRQAAQ